MDRMPSGRPNSTRPISAVPVPRTAMTSRPITQQGLTGLRPLQSSSGVGSNRMYKDKRYYISQIQKRTNETKDEISRLKKETKEFRIVSINLPELQKSAKEMAAVLSEKQEELNVLNMVLDLHLSKTNLTDMEAETNRLERKYESMTKTLEQGYQKNAALTQELNDLKKEASRREQIIQQKVNDLPPQKKAMYYELVERNEGYLARIAEMQDDIKKKKEYVDEQQKIFSQSPMKQKFYEKVLLLEKLSHRNQELEDFVNNTKTPEQERQILLEQLKKEKSDIEALTKVKLALETDIKEAERRAAEKDHELDGKDTARIKKHKELRERGEHMDSFIESYDGKSKELITKMMENQRKIETALEFIAESETESNLKELHVNLEQDDSSLESWKNKFIMLTKNMKRSASILKRYQLELEKLAERKKEIKKEMKQYENPKEKHEELNKTKSNLMGQQAALQATLDSTKSAVTEAQRATVEEMQKIEDNDDINRLMKLEAEIEELEKKKAELLQQLEVESRNEEFDNVMENMGNLLQKRNEELIISLKNKKSKNL